jgi:hypothetical protein
LIRHPLIIAPIGAQRQALLTERLPCNAVRQGEGDRLADSAKVLAR